MAGFFVIGEQKVRPGLYYRYENRGLPPLAGVDDGKCAAVFRSNWGPLGRPIVIENFGDINRFYGDGGEAGTTDVPLEQFRGGARRVFCIRLGNENSGTHGEYQISDTDGNAVIKLILIHPGSRKFNITIRPTLADPNRGELLILEGTTAIERITFDTSAGIDQVTSLIDAVTATGSSYFSLTNITPEPVPENPVINTLAVVDQEAIAPGTDPAITVAEYTAAFEALESSRWNVLSIDTDDLDVHIMTQMYLNRVYQSGKYVMGVIGEDSEVDFETRLKHAAAYNDYQLIYVGGGYTDMEGNAHEGWRASARIAGMIAGTPSNESVTRLPITGAVELTERLTNYEYEQSLLSGMLTFSTSSADTVWIEQGINSLVMPGTKEDDGWKKIKRVKIRFELFQRINDTLERLIGRINNDSDGRMTVIQLINGVCNAMVAEKKLLPGAHGAVDTDNPPKGDSAWFLILADDIDAFEKGYFKFEFRFAPDETT